jgi:hypothetical protein
MSLQLVNLESLDALFGGGALPIESTMQSLATQSHWIESGAESGEQGMGILSITADPASA